jgi:uncharacterized repeat protein (TIGR01451 family)
MSRLTVEADKTINASSVEGSEIITVADPSLPQYGAVGINNLGTINCGAPDIVVIGTDPMTVFSDGAVTGTASGLFGAVGISNGGLEPKRKFEDEKTFMEWLSSAEAQNPENWILRQGKINGDQGNDRITGTATINFPNSPPLPIQGIGLINEAYSVINGGAGNDTIEGNGTTSERIAAEGIINYGEILGGPGDDRISGKGISASEGLAGVGISLERSRSLPPGSMALLGHIDGGDGNDTIIGSGTWIGIYSPEKGGLIEGGSGNDWFISSIVDASGNIVSKEGATEGVILSGGSGNDTFDVGYGNDTIDGGDGWDKVLLPGTRQSYLVDSINSTYGRAGKTLKVFNVEEVVFQDDDSEPPIVNEPPTGFIYIDGTPKENNLLTVNNVTLADADGLGVLNYEWQKSSDGIVWNSIGGATSSIFMPDDTYVGYRLRVKVFYIDGHGTAESLLSSPTNPILKSNKPPTGSVLIEGTPREDSPLSAKAETLADPDGLGGLYYQWLESINGQSWTLIDGANSQQFIPGDAQVGHYLRVQTSYIDGQGTLESVLSLPTKQIENINDLPKGSIEILGLPYESSQLRINTSTLEDGDGLGPLNYQWQVSDDGVNWTDISGATDTIFIPRAEQVNQLLRAVVSYNDGQGTAESLVSTATELVGTVSISGKAILGQTLTAYNTVPLIGNKKPFKQYQWEINLGTEKSPKWVNIVGATNNTYTLSTRDVGRQMRVAAFFDPEYALYPDEPALSDITSIVEPANIPQPSFSISSIKATVKEGETAAFRVVLSQPYFEELRVYPITENLTTDEAQPRAHFDYVLDSPTITFQPGEIEKTILVRTVDDNIDEDIEQFLVSIYAAESYNHGLTNSFWFDESNGGMGIGTILDDDTSASKLSITSISMPTGSEQSPIIFDLSKYDDSYRELDTYIQYNWTNNSGQLARILQNYSPSYGSPFVDTDYNPDTNPGAFPRSGEYTDYDGELRYGHGLGKTNSVSLTFNLGGNPVENSTGSPVIEAVVPVHWVVIDQDDLSIQRTDNANEWLVGQELEYKIRIHDQNKANGYELRTELPRGVLFKSLSPSLRVNVSYENGKAIVRGIVYKSSDTSEILLTVVPTLESLQESGISEESVVSFPVTIEYSPYIAKYLIDPEKDNNTVYLGKLPRVDLEINKEDTPDPAQVGEPLTYTLTVLNNSDTQATGVVVTDTLPEGVTFISSSKPGFLNNNILTFQLGTLPANSNQTIDVKVIPSEVGEITNIARVKSQESDDDPKNNKAIQTTKVESGNVQSGKNIYKLSSWKYEKANDGDGFQIVRDKSIYAEFSSNKKPNPNVVYKGGYVLDSLSPVTSTDSQITTVQEDISDQFVNVNDIMSALEVSATKVDKNGNILRFDGNPGITISFGTTQSISFGFISQATLAHLLKYTHFNWIQVVGADKESADWPGISSNADWFAVNDKAKPVANSGVITTSEGTGKFFDLLPGGNVIYYDLSSALSHYPNMVLDPNDLEGVTDAFKDWITNSFGAKDILVSAPTETTRFITWLDEKDVTQTAKLEKTGYGIALVEFRGNDLDQSTPADIFRYYIDLTAADYLFGDNPYLPSDNEYDRGGLTDEYTLVLNDGPSLFPKPDEKTMFTTILVGVKNENNSTVLGISGEVTRWSSDYNFYTNNGGINIATGSGKGVGGLSALPSSTNTLMATEVGTGTVEITATSTSSEFTPDEIQFFEANGVDVTPSTVNLAVVRTTPTDTIDLGQDYTYTLTVTNKGSDPASSVILTEALPTGVDFISATALSPSSPETTPSVTVDGDNLITASLGILKSGQSALVTITARSAYPGQLYGATNVTSDEYDIDVKDNFLISSQYIKPISVNNFKPIARNDFTLTTQDTPTTIPFATLLANDKDSDGDALTIIGVSNATNGAVELVRDGVFFTPVNQFRGDASFDYTLSDGKGGTAIAIVTIKVVARPNQTPIVQSDKTLTLVEDSESTLLGISAPTDPDGDSLTITANTLPDPTKGTLQLANGTSLSLNQTLMASVLVGLTFQPLTNENGNAGTFSYTVSDGKGGTAT